ncbi:GNAT family N-acetyltransferase [Marivita sp. S6314]|uniref:GNAT family N-acetyltransferase n=1 Tax=Marivita sp. S6314 TaxID=2926406 RepID=UPI001FF10AA1|nr:GNAT family N-acetyltransferase [Marivita sp. S6314]MCK0150009.1 GNAT family N-acetyltransferase [Marivita sp. S6314]
MTPAAFAQVMDRAYVDMRPWSEAEIARTLDTPHVILLAHPQGGLLLQTIAGEAEILAFAVDPAAQRTGIATTLLTRAIAQARQEGADRLFLEVAAANVPARAFYAARGFAQIGKRRAYYTLRDGRKDDALVLSRPIPLDPGPDTPTS